VTSAFTAAVALGKGGGAAWTGGAGVAAPAGDGRLFSAATWETTDVRRGAGAETNGNPTAQAGSTAASRQQSRSQTKPRFLLPAEAPMLLRVQICMRA
jgi:hypothetical protein